MNPDATTRDWLWGGASITVSLLLLWVTLLLAHPVAWQGALLLSYVLAFNALPGAAALAWWDPRGARRSGWLALMVLPVGLAVNLLAVLPAWLLGNAAPLLALPVLATASLVLAYRRGWRPAGPPHFAWWPLTTVFLCLSSFMGMANVLAGDTDWAFSFHSAFQGNIVRGLEGGWPPRNLLLPGVDWSYNYGAHLWVLGVARITGLPLDALVARHAPLVFAFAAAGAMLAVGQRLLGLYWWAAALSLLGVFWIVGIPPIAGQVFATFMPFSGVLLLSPFLAVALFLVTLWVLTHEQEASPLGRAIVLVLLMLLLTGARAVAPPVLLCALGLHLLVAAWGTRRIPWHLLVDLAACIVGLALGWVLFFNPGGGLNGLGFVHFNGHPFKYLTAPTQYLLTVPHMLMAAGLPPLPSGAVAFVAIALFQTSFLLPALWAGLESLTRSKPALFLVGAAIAGIFAVFLFEAPGYSHFSFLNFANVSLCMLGALGFQRLITRVTGGWRAIPLALVGGLLLVHLAQLRGPGAQWLVSEAPRRLAAALAGGTEALHTSVASCLDPADAALMHPVQMSQDATVIFVPRLATGTFYCRTFWALVYAPAQGMSNYALTFVPGRASSGLSRVLMERSAEMNAAMDAAARKGDLAMSHMLALAMSLPPGGNIFIMADRTLLPDLPERVEAVGTGAHFLLWRVR
ncbi:MAG: hypothetical protein HEQ16_04565 [Bosea sp.]|nr:hypothetical protein [Bosea sp. (in: a-proteobacteria)]